MQFVGNKLICMYDCSYCVCLICDAMCDCSYVCILVVIPCSVGVGANILDGNLEEIIMDTVMET